MSKVIDCYERRECYAMVYGGHDDPVPDEFANAIDSIRKENGAEIATLMNGMDVRVGQYVVKEIASGRLSVMTPQVFNQVYTLITQGN